LTNFQLIGIQDTSLGVCPKSLLSLKNGDLILGTFSSSKGYTFKSFHTDPFSKIVKVKNETDTQKTDHKKSMEDFGGLYPLFDAMNYQSHFYKFHELDENSFYRFDSKQFYIIRKYPSSN
tara:strand:+ start:438 stop:797 length:360 start_codon:yes stop_codon:yes gene_type:complete